MAKLCAVLAFLLILNDWSMHVAGYFDMDHPVARLLWDLPIDYNLFWGIHWGAVMLLLLPILFIRKAVQ